MSLIGFDTSLATTSVCVLRDDGAAFFTPPPGPERLLGPARHSDELLPELERRLRESGTSWDEVASIAIGIGPGTFTGLRIGVSTARALGQALEIPLRPVSSLEVLAAGCIEEPLARERPVLSLIDARRGQVFVALYETGTSNLETLWEPSVVDPEALLERVRALDPAPVCVGDWAIKSRAELEAVGGYVPPSDTGPHAVSALHLCRLAMSTEAVPPAEVYPVYLRLPDAEVTKRVTAGDGDDGQDR
jgi:tRNA threonylcarbamoyladenosine biosynthesis protein TsaB